MIDYQETFVRKKRTYVLIPIISVLLQTQIEIDEFVGIRAVIEWHDERRTELGIRRK